VNDNTSDTRELVVGRLDELDDPGCREFRIGNGDWPFRGFIVRQGDNVYAYQNYCAHLGHPLNWKPDHFLTKDRDLIMCASHGALYDIDSGRCIAGPCKGKSLRRVEARVEGGKVVVRGPVSLR
jgi:nitrite reductase/ring-hydroxylating ferredoxin subunit